MLFTPPGPNSFRNKQLSTDVRPATNFGVTVTPTVGSYGSWADLVTSTTYDSYGILINSNSLGVSTASVNTTINIGIDPAGGTSFTVVIPSLIVGNSASYTALGGGLWYYFPLFIPAGSRVAAQARGSAVTACRVFCQLHQQPRGPECVRRASFVEAIGITDNVGTTLTAGTTSEGSWTLLGTTSKPCWWWQLGTQVVSSDTGHAAVIQNIDIAYGDGTNYIPIIVDAYYATTSAEIATTLPWTAGVEYYVPAGGSIYMRQWSSGTADSQRVAVYGAGG